MYTDDTQVYGSCWPTDWMRSNGLQLNPDKTEVLWCATGRRQHQIPTHPPLINGCSVSRVLSVRDLGIYVDHDLSTRTQVTKTVSPCFVTLRQLRQFRYSVPVATLQALVIALVHSRLDYGNAVLVGIPAYLQRRLQSVLNVAAWLLPLAITDALISLHWLQVPELGKYKVAVLTYKALHNTARLSRVTLGHSSVLLSYPVGAHFALLSLTAWRCPLFVFYTQSVTRRFRLPPRRTGTVCRTTSHLLHLSLPSTTY